MFHYKGDQLRLNILMRTLLNDNDGSVMSVNFVLFTKNDTQFYGKNDVICLHYYFRKCLETNFVDDQIAKYLMYKANEYLNN